MSYTWGPNSTKCRKDICSELNKVSDIVLQIRDHSIICGHRPKDEQDDAYYANPQRSKLKWPKGKHNKLPSIALDMEPYPRVEGTLREDLTYIAGLYVGIGRMLGYDIRWGGDWDRDGETADNSWDDLFHIEFFGMLI